MTNIYQVSEIDQMALTRKMYFIPDIWAPSAFWAIPTMKLSCH